MGKLVGRITVIMEPDLHAATRETRDQKCPRCDYAWDVLGLSEYGAWSPFDANDLICPDCGRNLMEVEGMKFITEPAYSTTLKKEVRLFKYDNGEIWVAYNHPDGQWVSLRKATDKDKNAFGILGAGDNS